MGRIGHHISLVENNQFEVAIATVEADVPGECFCVCELFYFLVACLLFHNEFASATLYVVVCRMPL